MGQIVMSRELGQSISKMQGFVGCSGSLWSVRTKMRSKGEQLLNWQKGHEHPRLTEEHGEWRVGCLVHCQRTATLAQIAEKWPLSTTESIYSGHVRVRTGYWNNGTRWADLLNVVFFHHMHGWVYVCHLPGEEMDALWVSEPCSPHVGLYRS